MIDCVLKERRMRDVKSTKAMPSTGKVYNKAGETSNLWNKANIPMFNMRVYIFLERREIFVFKAGIPEHATKCVHKLLLLRWLQIFDEFILKSDRQQNFEYFANCLVFGPICGLTRLGTVTNCLTPRT
jgi:hypothetical protein